MISEPHFGNTWKSQVKVEVSHHAFSDGQWSCTKPLVFVMDDPPNGEVKKEKTKKKTVPITQKKFGSYLDIEKIKSSQVMVLAWRCRLLALHCAVHFFLGGWFLVNFFQPLFFRPRSNSIA